ncbi:MAG: ferrous iron transporter B [Lachnospiraceae bacterium]|nr:ferrous iron transporter B [Lachnospiraceae bacterium]
MRTIALLGQPNSGKSTVFNALTGSRQHVGNWPGKTVEKSQGSFTYEGETYEVVDLPGSYGLSGNSDEEIITTEYIKSNQADLTLVLVDASQLERSMFMMAEFAMLGKPAILVLNMMDVVKNQGKTINETIIENNLNIPVLPFVAANGKEYDKLKNLIKSEINNPHIPSNAPDVSSVTATGEQGIQEKSRIKYEWIGNVLEGAQNQTAKKYVMTKFDRALTTKFWGKILCFLIVLVGFLVAMIVMSPFMSIAQMIPAYIGGPIAKLMASWNVNPWLASVFSALIPNTLYFCISMAAFVFGVNLVFGFLEEVGFLARAAYQFDNILSKIGLQGKAVCPLLMGFGCTIGGASGTRVMDNWGQRMLAMAVVWSVPCASIWTIIPIIASSVFSPVEVILICVGILCFVFVMMWIVSGIFGRFLSPKGSMGGMIMELPPIHKPHWGHIFKEAILKAWDIFKRALVTVFLVSIIFWVFLFSVDGKVESSLIYKVGTFIEPVTRFFGMSWRTFMGFVASAFAKEAVLGVLNAVYVGQNSLMDATFNAGSVATDTGVLASAMGSMMSKAEALALIVAVTFNIPCVMALNTTFKESHSFKWTAIVACFYIGAALVLAAVVYHIGMLF